MPDWKYGTPLRKGMVGDPVLHYEMVDLDVLGVPEPTDAEMEQIFVKKASKVRTWNRRHTPQGVALKVNDPHWLAVKKGVQCHIDTGFPRYSHQLKVRVDPNTFITGNDEIQYPLVRGLYYILDAHSPHEVLATGADSFWNVTAAIDHNIQLNPDTTLKRLLEYVKTNHILEGSFE